jgi:hypothetical protein
MSEVPMSAEGTSMEDAISALENQDPNRIVIRSEFACVSVRLRDPGGRPRLVIEDLRTRQTVELDAIELETLAWIQHKDLAPLLDPSNTRWVGTGD